MIVIRQPGVPGWQEAAGSVSIQVRAVPAAHPLRSLPVNHFFHVNNSNMYYNQSCGRRYSSASEAATGTAYGNPSRPGFIRSQQRAAVNIYKTGTSFEMLVFAPGRIKEHFHLDVSGNLLTVSYTPPEGFPRPDWVLREYSRGGFKRSFSLDERIDTQQISAKYTDGVLQVSLPLLADKENPKKEIVIS